MPRYYAKVGYGTRSGFYRTHVMEVTAPTIRKATKMAADRVRNDRRRQVRDVKDIEVVLRMSERK